eukprot:2399951-Prymnesium_polylepis.1
MCAATAACRAMSAAAIAAFFWPRGSAKPGDAEDQGGVGYRVSWCLVVIGCQKKAANRTPSAPRVAGLRAVGLRGVLVRVLSVPCRLVAVTCPCGRFSFFRSVLFRFVTVSHFVTYKPRLRAVRHTRVP